MIPQGFLRNFLLSFLSNILQHLAKLIKSLNRSYREHERFLKNKYFAGQGYPFMI